MNRYYRTQNGWAASLLSLSKIVFQQPVREERGQVHRRAGGEGWLPRAVLPPGAETGLPCPGHRGGDSPGEPASRPHFDPNSRGRPAPILGRAAPQARYLCSVVAPPNPTEKIPPEKTGRSGAESTLETTLENPAVGEGTRANCGESGEPGEKPRQRKTRKTGWRWAQSAANPSPPNSLFNRENTGNFRDFGAPFENQTGRKRPAFKGNPRERLSK